MRKKLPIFYSALMLTGVNLLLRLAGTTFQVYISGRIGASGVGLLQLVMSVGGLAVTAGMAGIRTTAMYLTAEELGRGRANTLCRVLSGCFLYSILCSGLVGSAVYVLAPHIAAGWIGEPDAIGAIRLLAGFLPVNCLCGIMSGYFTAANRIGTLAAVEIAEQAISIISTVLLLTLWAGRDPVTACEAVVIGSGLSSCCALCLLVLLRIRERPANAPPLPICRRLLRCAVPLAGADILKSGISTTENMMVPQRLKLYSGISDPLAAFGTVCGMVFPVLMFPAAIVYALAELLIPELARCAAAGSSHRIQYLVRRSLKAVMLYGCAFSCVMFLLSQWLCLKLYGSREAGLWLTRFSLLIPMLYCDAITDAMTKGLGQQRSCVRYNILTSAMDVALLYLLLPVYGMQGYFFSFLVTHGVNFLLSLRRLVKISGIRIRLWMPLLAAAATALGIAAGSALSHPFLSCLCALPVTGLLLFLWKVVDREELDWLLGLAGKK